MPHFAYKAYLKNGKIDSGTIDAGNERSAFQALSKSGKLPFQLQATNRGDVTPSRKERAAGFSLSDRVDNTRMFSEMSVLLQSGFTVDQAISAMVADTRNRAEKGRFETILTKLNEGNPVAGSFMADDLPSDVIALISAGENSGNLPKVFQAISTRYEEAEKRRKEVQEALLYPLFLVVMMVAAIFVLAFYLVPAIEPIFEGSEARKPAIVSVLSAFRQFLSKFGLWIMVLSLLGTLSILVSDRVRRQLVSLRQYLPFVANFIEDGAVARYLRTLHLLLSNGVTMKEALRLATETATAGPLRSTLARAQDDVTSGSSLHTALSKTNLLTDGLVAHLRIGEESNNLPTMLSRAASAMELRQKRKLERLLKFLTPAITILLGLLIGGLVTSVMTTLLSINDVAIR